MTWELRIKKEMDRIKRKIERVHDPARKARLIYAYVDLLETLDVTKLGD